METFGAIITMAFGVLLVMGGADGLRNLRQNCDRALKSGLTEPSWRIKAWVWTLYFVTGAGVLTAGTLMFGLTLRDLIF